MRHLFSAKHIRRPQTRVARLEVSFVKAAWIAAALTAAASVAYAVQMSSVASKGYVIRQLEKEVTGLREGAEKTEVKLVAGQSVKRVEEKVREMGMVPAETVEYVTMDAAVAVARK